MDIQSIYGVPKTTSVASPSSDEDKSPAANGFAALLDMVGTQFKATLGIGMDPVVIKQDAKPEVQAPEPRDSKARPERTEDKDPKAKPANDDGAEDDAQTEETAASDDQAGEAADAGANQAGPQQQEAAQAVVAAIVDAALVAQTVAVAPVVANETVVQAIVQTAAVDVEVATADTIVVDPTAKTAETVIEVKAAAQTEVKAAEKVVAPEAIVRDTTRAQQAINAYAPVQTADDVEMAAVEAETVTAQAKTAAKDNAVRTLEVRSVAAQEQANSLARLLGSENRIQVQVTTTAAHASKQSVADVSIYNIYAGYTAADAISLANGAFGQADVGAVPNQAQATQAQPAAARAEIPAQAAIIATAPHLPGSASNAAGAPPVRGEAAAPVAVQATASSSGASNTGMNFTAFTQSGQSSGAQQTQQAAHPNPTDRPAATAQHVIDQIKVNITRAAKAGLDRVTIQLKPVELGRIEIKLEMSEDHKVRVTVIADTKDTLNLLQTDSRTLERTLNDAGLRTDANNLHFNLRSETDAGAADDKRGNGGAKNGANAHEENANDNADPAYDYAAAAYARGGIDTFA